MATCCLDVHLEGPFPANDVDSRYDRVFLLVFRHGRPVGELTVSSELYRQWNENAFQEAVGRFVYQSENQPTPAATYQSRSPTATIAVCSHERPEQLNHAIESILALPDDGQEVIVVDSGPRTGVTAELVATYPTVNYLVEKRPGLSRARNRALRDASGEIVAFTDDDAMVDRNWLRSLLPPFDDRLVQCVTGLTVPLELETTAQELQEEFSSFGRGYKSVVHDWSTLSPGAAGRAGAGVNMAFRKSILDDVGPFDEALDAGTPSRSGGDNDMFYRVLAEGYRIAYEPAALVRHCHRRSMEELVSAFRGYGTGVYAAWTRELVYDRDLTVLHNAAAWLFKYQLPQLIRASLGRSGGPPRELIVAELKGCLDGPRAYFAARGALS